jgi:P-type Cu+ transporter
MRRYLPVAILALAAVVAVITIAGCTNAASKPAASAAPPSGRQMDHAAMGHTGGDPATGAKMVSCPVLGMTTAKSDAIPYEYQGKTYYLCCQDCVEKFKADPQKYIDKPAPAQEPGAPMAH